MKLGNTLLMVGGLALSTLTIKCAVADTVLGLYVGAQAWDMDVDGGFANGRPVNDFNFSGQTAGSVYAALEHPIPLLPNAMLRYTDMGTDSKQNPFNDFIFDNQLFVPGTEVVSTADIESIDLTLYYEFFDNDLISWDFGLTVKSIDGMFAVAEANNPSRIGQQDVDEYIPTLYTKLAIGLPFTGFGAFVEGNFLSLDHNVYDYQAAITYTFIDSALLDLTAQLGYKLSGMDFDDLDSIYSDLEYDGAYVGVEFHF